MSAWKEMQLTMQTEISDEDFKDYEIALEYEYEGEGEDDETYRC